MTDTSIQTTKLTRAVCVMEVPSVPLRSYQIFFSLGIYSIICKLQNTFINFINIFFSLKLYYNV
jgi:hypothetical protein